MGPAEAVQRENLSLTGTGVGDSVAQLCGGGERAGVLPPDEEEEGDDSRGERGWKTGPCGDWEGN